MPCRQLPYIHLFPFLNFLEIPPISPPNPLNPSSLPLNPTPHITNLIQILAKLPKHPRLHQRARSLPHQMRLAKQQSLILVK
jgi:hypothetical protein